jgi:pyridoxal phosphate enzyme (YggS family)
VDRTRVADALAKAVERAGTEPLRVLVQVNVAGEDQKTGCAPDDAGALVAHVAALSGLRLEGLMTMAPLTDDERVQRLVFAGLRELRDRLATPERPLAELSMGMTNDFRAAVAEGATILRLGTALFGAREPV